MHLNAISKRDSKQNCFSTSCAFLATLVKNFQLSVSSNVNEQRKVVHVELFQELTVLV